jgi:hypothetical protein
VVVISDISKIPKTFIFMVKRLSKKNHEEMYFFLGSLAPRMNTVLPFNTQELNPSNTTAHNRTDCFHKQNAGSAENVMPYKPLQ